VKSHPQSRSSHQTDTARRHYRSGIGFGEADLVGSGAAVPGPARAGYGGTRCPPCLRSGPSPARTLDRGRAQHGLLNGCAALRSAADQRLTARRPGTGARPRPATSPPPSSVPATTPASPPTPTTPRSPGTRPSPRSRPGCREPSSLPRLSVCEGGRQRDRSAIRAQDSSSASASCGETPEAEVSES